LPDDGSAENLEAAKTALDLDEMDAIVHCALGRVHGNIGMAVFDATIVQPV
jgi:hypothetical protein